MIKIKFIILRVRSVLGRSLNSIHSNLFIIELIGNSNKTIWGFSFQFRWKDNMKWMDGGSLESKNEN